MHWTGLAIIIFLLCLKILHNILGILVCNEDVKKSNVENTASSINGITQVG